MIVTVTLNPSLDKTLSVPKLRLGQVNRSQIAREDLGGKGINVSRALRALGVESRILAVVAGDTGQTLRKGLLAAGFDGHFVEAEGQTRQNITLLDESSSQYTKLNEPGPTLSPAQANHLQRWVEQAARPGDLWAFCGSLPPGAPIDLYASLIRLVQAQGGRAFLDASGQALSQGLVACPYAAKPNSEEAAGLLRSRVDSQEEHVAAVCLLQARGIQLVALTRGKRGLVLGLHDDLFLALPPSVAAQSPIGAGDAALAGMLWATADGCDAAETARRAVACGTATAMQEGTAVGEWALVQDLLEQVRVICVTAGPSPDGGGILSEDRSSA